MLMKRQLLVASERGLLSPAFCVLGCVLEALCTTGTHSQRGMLPTALLPQCNYKPRHKSWLTFALSHMFVQRLQKYCTRHVIAIETKITLLNCPRVGGEGEFFESQYFSQ